MKAHSLLIALGFSSAGVLPGCLDKSAEERPTRSASRALTQLSPSLDFTCDTSAVVAETTLRQVTGAPGETLALEPTGEPCRYHLLYRDTHGGGKRLSDKPALYAITHAERFSDAALPETTIVCASPIEHKKSKAQDTRSNRANRTVESVTLRCAAERGGDWTEVRHLVDGGEEYAAWVVNVTASPSGPDAFAVTWVRDSGFQFFNFSDAGRPPTDGVYQTTFTFAKGKKIEIGDTTRLSASIASVEVKGR